MIGYCLKDEGEEHFQFCYKMLVLNRCKRELMNMSSFCKNRFCLTHNIMKRVATFYKYKMTKIGSTLLNVLLQMLRSRQF
jgi:hypothetical protein